jgi:5-deoxy-glucuronate isomerase
VNGPNNYRGERILLDVRYLARGTRESFAPPPGDEAAVVLLRGEVEWCGERAARTDVFAGRASAVFLPAGSAVDVVAHAPTELGYTATRGAGLRPAPDAAPALVRPDDVVVHERGRPPWRRAVHDVVAASVPAQRLLVGETFNEPGQWSSFPPHKHDGADGETALEEVYYFRFDPPGGFGFQGLYEPGGSERAVLLRHGTIVGIPSGYHPVCSAPGYRLYYLWALAGESRTLTMHEDPAHGWLHEHDARDAPGLNPR